MYVVELRTYLLVSHRYVRMNLYLLNHNAHITYTYIVMVQLDYMVTCMQSFTQVLQFCGLLLALTNKPFHHHYITVTERRLSELVLASQDLVGAAHFYCAFDCNCQSIVLHEGGSIVWASAKQQWHNG